MFVDFLFYREIFSFAWRHKQWPGRTKTLLKLMFVTPLITVFHAVFFLLDYVFFPALWKQKVKTPVFIVGHARSGTTLMHRLMASDGERFSFFYYWEMFFPALTQRAIIKAIAWLDRTVFSRTIEKRLQAWDKKRFGPTRHIHNQGLWIPEEDQFAMNASLVTQQWTLEMPVVDKLGMFHIDRLPERRKARWMHHYKECVKRQLLANGGNKTHLSKNPAMTGWVNAILQTFPDAKIVVMVRDPIQCIPSTLKLMEGSWQWKKWRAEDYAKSLEAMIEISFDSYRLPAQSLSRHPATPHSFVDYRDLTSDPKRTVESVYADLGLEVSQSYANNLAEQQERQKKHSSKFNYDIKDYVVTPEQIERELDQFYIRYQWPRPSDQVSANGLGSEKK